MTVLMLNYTESQFWRIRLGFVLSEKIWFNNHPLKYLLWPLLWPLSLLFKMISSQRREAYISGKKETYRPTFASYRCW